jgi:hypothetical protein
MTRQRGESALLLLQAALTQTLFWDKTSSKKKVNLALFP